MLQLKHLNLLKQLTGVQPEDIKALKFGYEINYTVATTYILASQAIPANVSLVVLRVQTYLVNIDATAADYQFYRCVPTGVAWWRIANDTGTTAAVNWTNPNAPSQLALDSDELLLFPSGHFANLFFTATNVAPGVGTWRIRATVFGYFVPPQVSDALGGPQSWINVQQ